MDDEKIKLAFLKVKQDMSYLSEEVSMLKLEIIEVKDLLKNLYEEINTQKLHELANQTIQQINPTNIFNPTDNPTVRQEIKGLKSPNLNISIGNEGVPTDRQTDRQTDNPTHKIAQNSIEKSIREASEILNSLDILKKQIRLKFKKITDQEMVVFSTIYQLEEQGFGDITYKRIADHLKLSESSIRDYVQRIISKDIPIRKQKVNNKKIILTISPELKKIASLATILQLREL